MDKCAFGSFIAQARRDAGMTQQMLADRLHVTDKAVSKWERGLCFPDLTLIEPLAAELGLTVTELINCCKAPQDTLQTHSFEQGTRSVLDMGKEEVRRQKRKTILLAAVLAVLFLVAVCAGTEYYFADTAEPVHTRIFYKQEDANGCYLYVEDGKHLVRLRCEDRAVYDSIIIHKDMMHCIEYRWNRFTFEGVLESYVPEQNIETVGSPMDTIGGFLEIDNLLGIDRVYVEKRNIYPDPYREKGFLYTLKFNYSTLPSSEEELPVLDMHLVTVESCRNYIIADIDEDGITELLVHTRYDEAPYLLYDREDGQLVYHFLDEEPISVQDMLWVYP